MASRTHRRRYQEHAPTPTASSGISGARIGQLLAENHYGEIADDLHSHGMRYYGEALEYHRPSLGDDMEMRSKTDVPMGAMWTWAGSPGPDIDYISDLRGAASVAHIYGQNWSARSR